MNCRRAVWPVALAALLLGGCAAEPRAASPPSADEVSRLLQPLLPTSILLLGEQHDAPEHHALQRAVVQSLHASGQLAALVLEMAEQGMPAKPLSVSASEATVQQALNWSDSWPWASYGPVVMTAVRAGVPVLGANLPRSRMREAMGNAGLDSNLPAEALAKQREQIRQGHCDLLPATQIDPMTRIQIARDQTMAQTAVQAVRAHAKPGQTVLLIAGNGHVRRDLGVPVFLPSDLPTKVLMPLAREDRQEGASEPGLQSQADRIWVTAPRPARDYCADVMPPAKRP